MLRRIALVLALVAAHGLAGQAADLEVLVTDREGRPFGGAVVVAEPLDGAPPVREPLEQARMSQRNLSFEPELLVVRTGTPVMFPNEDAVKHHVYSFSPAKRFELSLYSGSEHPPETFGRPGIVTLGCNIHDSMIGYVYVTDSPHFGKTDVDGRLWLRGVGSGAYDVRIWHPRMKPGEPEPTQRVTLDDGVTAVRFELQRKLKPERSNNPTAKWSGY